MIVLLCSLFAFIDLHANLSWLGHPVTHFYSALAMLFKDTIFLLYCNHTCLIINMNYFMLEHLEDNTDRDRKR